MSAQPPVPLPILQGERCLLRALVPADAPAHEVPSLDLSSR